MVIIAYPKIKGKQMKKITLLTLVALSMLFTACGEKTKKAVEETAPAVQEAIKEDLTHAIDSAKEAVEKASEVTKAKASELATAASEKTQELKAQASDAIASMRAPDAYSKCKGCHGAKGEKAALGKSAIIGGQDKATLVASMQAYKAGTRNISGMGSLMKGQMASVSEADIEVIAEYLSSVK